MSNPVSAFIQNNASDPRSKIQNKNKSVRRVNTLGNSRYNDSIISRGNPISGKDQLSKN